MSARDAESYQRLFFEAAEDGMLLADAQERIADANPAACRLLGKERERLVGSALGMVFDPSDPFLRLARDEVRSSGIFKGSVRLMRWDGSSFPAEVSLVRGEDDALRGLVFRDLTERRRAEEALTKSKKRFETLVHDAPDLIIVAEADTTIRYTSPSVERIWGYKPEEIVGTKANEHIHPEDLEGAASAFGEVPEDSEATAAQGPVIRFRHKDGSWRYMEGIANNLLDDPCVGGLVFNSRDVTERVLAEQALKESEERFRKLTEATFEAIIIHDNGKILEVNDRFSAMFGYEYEEAVGMNVIDFAVPESRDLIRENVLSGYDKPYEAVGLRKDGTLFHGELRGMTITYQGRDVRVTSVRDITERKRAEEQLRQAETRYRTLVERIPAVVYIQEIGSSDSATYMSPQIETLTGYSPKECKNPDLRWRMVHPDDREQMRSEDKKTGEPGEVFTTEYRAVHRDGRTVWVHNEAVMVEEEAGGSRYWQGFMVDITELKQAEQEIRRLNQDLVRRAEELSRSNAELERFAYVVSHDLQAPLRRIEGFAEALLEDYGERLNVEGRDFLRRIVTSARRMGRLVVGLLELSRVASEEIRRERVDLSAIAGSVFEELRRTDPVRRVEFVAPEEAPVHGDPRLLRVVLGSLLGNAWKFTAERESGRIEFGKNGRGETLTYYVRDDGEGFDATRAEELFHVFEGMRPEKGSDSLGLGLAKARRIVERHGGRIWAEGEPGSGATFYFTLQGEDQ